MSVSGTPVSEVPCAIPEINRVSIRIPPFWPEQPAVWFDQIEAQFAINGVTADTTKFYYVMAQLEHKYALEVQDIFANPPEKDKYGTLKKELVHRLSASQSQRIDKLLEKEDIGDRTPSQFLRHMQNLAGTAVTEEFLRTLWARRLPAMTRAIINSQADLSLSKLAEIADQIRENTAHTGAASASHDRTNERLFERLEELTLQVAELTRSRSRDRPRGSFRERSCSPGRSRQAEKGTAGITGSSELIPKDVRHRAVSSRETRRRATECGNQ
ncbi:PREDICTED: uncharacterized protein LOC107194838 [Dufourea novaeangliae]|uniref:uncharacterized protein LOC107194838 n=1 Tax=Dufourea novaeangliae TaxID=178035 RepID=UPI0007672D60|nr:PREDICTED: uncharacterized protein LOC107194838 [Dufourea novaeangliae]